MMRNKRKITKSDQIRRKKKTSVVATGSSYKVNWRIGSCAATRVPGRKPSGSATRPSAREREPEPTSPCGPSLFPGAGNWQETGSKKRRNLKGASCGGGGGGGNVCFCVLS